MSTRRTRKPKKSKQQQVEDPNYARLSSYLDTALSKIEADATTCRSVLQAMIDVLSNAANCFAQENLEKLFESHRKRDKLRALKRSTKTSNPASSSSLLSQFKLHQLKAFATQFYMDVSSELSRIMVFGHCRFLCNESYRDYPAVFSNVFKALERGTKFRFSQDYIDAMKQLRTFDEIEAFARNSLLQEVEAELSKVDIDNEQGRATTLIENYYNRILNVYNSKETFTSSDEANQASLQLSKEFKLDTDLTFYTVILNRS